MQILTFDIEEWFHINNSDWVDVEQWPALENRIVNNTNTILSFLKRHNIKASFFVLGWVAEHYPELVRQIDKAGHDIGFHSFYHRIPRNQSPQEFEDDLKKGIAVLEDITGKKVKYYRAPNFSLKNKWMLSSLAKNGIELSSSIKNPIRHKGKRLPNNPFVFSKDNLRLIELPLVTKDILTFKLAYSGSGYFRVLPYSFIKKMLKAQEYQMLYFHPNDFDSDVPTKKELGFIRNTLNTVGTSTTLAKLEKLTNHLSFVSISRFMDSIDISQLEVIEY